MLYKCPGPYLYDGIYYDTLIVLECNTEVHLEEGWYLTQGEAKKEHDEPFEKIVDINPVMNEIIKKVTKKRKVKKKTDDVDFMGIN